MSSSFFSLWPRVTVCKSVWNKTMWIPLSLYFMCQKITAYISYAIMSPITGLRRTNSWKCESIELMPIFIVLMSKDCTSFPLVGYKACGSFWLYLSGVTRAWTEPLYLLCVPVCQRISGKWYDSCLHAPARTSGWQETCLLWTQASQNCHQWKKKRASRNRFLFIKAAVEKQKLSW